MSCEFNQDRNGWNWGVERVLENIKFDKEDYGTKWEIVDKENKETVSRQFILGESDSLEQAGVVGRKYFILKIL